jgi:hypothetical protein
VSLDIPITTRDSTAGSTPSYFSTINKQQAARIIQQRDLTVVDPESISPSSSLPEQPSASLSVEGEGEIDSGSTTVKSRC